MRDGSKIAKIKVSGNSLYNIIAKGKYELIVKAQVCDDLGTLKAPTNGTMKYVIKEGLTGHVNIRLLKIQKPCLKGKAIHVP